MEEGLDETQVHGNPYCQFQQWYESALASDIVPDRNAMALATATRDGRPSARMVLLKSFDERGFVFFSNYESRKGEELADNPRAALVLYWPELHRQIRIEGDVEEIPPDESDAYFATRARGSQVAARASRQSTLLAGRSDLERSFQQVERAYDGHEIPRPDTWGGYRVVPSSIEFWQGRRDRLHDRLRYCRSANGGWVIERLAP